MNKKFILIIVVFFIIQISVTGCGYRKSSNNNASAAIIINKGKYYNVTLDFTKAKSHKQVGEEYGEEILKVVPNYETMVDSYIKYLVTVDNDYRTIIKRAKGIEAQLDKAYKDEIEGMASKLSNSKKDIPGDGKLSKDEIYLMSLLPDVLSATKGSALAVYGQRSKSGHTLVATSLEFSSDLKNDLAKIQAVTTFNNNGKSICTVGYLGYLGVIAGFNCNKVFASILASKTNEIYSSNLKRSYPFDLRYALENCYTLDDVGSYLKEKERNYAFSNLIFLADSKSSKVLENNQALDSNAVRDFRTEKSILNTGISWDVKNSIGCVNSFLLNGNYDNHSYDVSNVKRWDNMKKELLSKGNSIGIKEIKEITDFYSGSKPGDAVDGDLYDKNFQQKIIFEPNNYNLQVFFRTTDDKLPKNPVYLKINLKDNNNRFWKIN